MPLRSHHTAGCVTDTPLFILRIAGLPMAQLAALSSCLVTEELPLCLECEETSRAAREELELWLSREIGSAAPEFRSRLLTLRRDCRQGKSLERYRELALGEGGRRLEEALLAPFPA